MAFETVGGVRLEIETVPAARDGASTIVFLHEGLGSPGQWRDFPRQVAQATGCAVMVYARRGHGQSDALAEARDPGFMHVEALEVLPALLQHLDIERPILFGHSDGGSIALIHAGHGHPVRGLIVEAPHVFVEDRSIAGIEAARRAFVESDLRDRLARYHADVDSAFWGWNDIWLHPDFRAWNIEDCLSGIRCPVLAIQGEDDAYGTMAQLDAVARRVSGEVRLLKLARCGHAPHRDRREAALEAVTAFVRQMPD
jgi:pimeloyl-ACP methyl ester carboxylesterase